MTLQQVMIKKLRCKPEINVNRNSFNYKFLKRLHKKK